jgi:DNA-binding GntR family transcriptional regulator
MVKFERNRGVRILETSVHDLEEIFELRLSLEVPATLKAVERMSPTLVSRLRKELKAMLRAAEAGNEREMWRHDRAFHLEILKASGNLRLAQYVDSLRDLILMRGSTTANRSRSLVEIARDHRPVFNAVERRDATGAADEMRRHIRRTSELIMFQEAPRTSRAAELGIGSGRPSR